MSLNFDQFRGFFAFGRLLGASWGGVRSLMGDFYRSWSIFGRFFVDFSRFWVDFGSVLGSTLVVFWVGVGSKLR